MYRFAKSFFLTTITLFFVSAIAFPAEAIDIDMSGATTPDESAVSQTIPVFLSSAHSSSITVNYNIADDTAIEGDDYTDNTSGTLVFAAGETVKSINIPIIQDSIDEDTESLFVNITSTTFGNIVTNQVSLNITDDDLPPAISIGDNSSANENSAITNLTVTLDAASGKTITLDYATSDGTATAGNDYTAVSTTPLTFNPSETSKVIPISVVADNLDEVDETVIVTLANPSNASISDATGVLTISDDDPEPSLSVDNSTTSDENSADVTVRLSTASAKNISVGLGASSGTATSGTDFNSFSTSVSFNAGETAQTVTIPLINDTLDEDNETFTVTLSGPTNASISSSTATITILDDDPTPTLSIQDVSQNENSGTASAIVLLSAASAKDVTVNYATSNGTATAGDDYTAISATPLTFSAGQTSKTINTIILNDSIDEDDETFTLTLSSPDNATISTTAGSATMTIVDDDPAPTISISDNSSGESGTGNLIASLSAASEKTITIDYATSDGTATAGDDYTAVSTTPLTFSPGEISKNIPITVASDIIDEVDETVIVTLSNPSNVTVSDGIGELTITDDDNAPTISIADAIIPNETAVPRSITLSLSTASTQTVEVDYATSDGTATAINDYVATSGTVTFNPGVTSQTIAVTMVQDNLAEIDETFSIDLSNPVNATISDNQSVVTITDDEGTPELSVADVSTSEVAANLVATISLSGTSSQIVTVNYATSDGTATAGDDYTAISAPPLTFNPGDLTKTVNIAILSDTTDEDDETFTFTLSSPDNATISTTAGSATMTIVDDDPAPTISISDNSSGESGTANLIASLSAASEKTITIDYATSDGTATAGDDYTAVSTTPLTFSPGEISKNIPITVASDIIDEVDETVIVTLSNPSNVTVSDGIGELTITDDDNAPTISIADAIIPNETAVPRSITLSLSTASTQTVEVDYATSDGTATAINDYVATSGTVTFNPGVTSQTIAVTMVQDNLAEIDETFSIDLSNPVNATISDNQSVVTITDDEGTPELSVADVSTSEVAANLVATISLSGTSSQIVTVNYATSDGTATAGDDYTAISAPPLTFNPGDLTKTVNIAILSDTTDEDDETFTFTLSSPDNATISTTAGSATMTIVDDDPAPTISISDNSSGESGTANLIASLSAASEKTITIDYATSDGTATAGDDYTAVSTTPLTFSPGEISKNIPITVASDIIDEVDETVIVTLSNPSNVTINDAIGELTITDDDGVPTISIADAIIPNETAVPRSITLSLSSESSQTISVDYSTADGTAAVNSDYNAVSGTVSFLPGELTTSINVNILSDTLSEGDETFYVNLSNPILATISDNQSVVTITDDDSVPSLSVSDAVTLNENSAAISTTVSLSNPSVSNVSVNWSTSDDTAVAGEDYNTAGGVLNFFPGEVSKTISVNILSDNIPEGIETFSIVLSNVSAGAVISDGSGTITITDDDGNPGISVSSVSVSEDAGIASIDVDLSHTTPLTVSVDYATVNLSAKAGEDFTYSSGTLTFLPGEESKSISVSIVEDQVFESNETFNLVLSNPVNTAIDAGTGVITILDDDELLSSAQAAVISDAILFGKNSALRSETAFFGRILSRNTSLLANNSQSSDGPILSFRNVNVDWSDLNEFAQGSFSYDNVREGGTRNTSWETSVSHTKNEGGTKNTFISTAFNFSRRTAKGSIYGLILGGGYSDTSMTGESVGSNVGRSLAAGVYAAYPIGSSLILDLMASKTFEVNTLNTKVGEVNVVGDYDRNSTAYSLGVEGNLVLGASSISPKFKYTVGKSVFDTGTFDIRKGSLTSKQQIDFGTDEYFRFSFSPEFRTSLGNRGSLIRPYGFNKLSVRPKYFCEKYDYEASKKCGQGFGLTFGNHHPLYNFDQDFILDYDEIDGSKTYSVNYKRTY